MRVTHHLLLIPCAYIGEGNKPFHTLTSVVVQLLHQILHTLLEGNLYGIIKPFPLAGLVHYGTTCAGDTVIRCGQCLDLVPGEKDVDGAPNKQVVFVSRSILSWFSYIVSFSIFTMGDASWGYSPDSPTTRKVVGPRLLACSTILARKLGTEAKGESERPSRRGILRGGDADRDESLEFTSIWG